MANAKIDTRLVLSILLINIRMEAMPDTDEL